MSEVGAERGPVWRDLAVPGGFAVVLLAVHFLLGDGYGFHRDELQFLSDARRLAWGYAAYPPMTALWGRVEVAVWGISPGVLRLPAAVANGVSLMLVGLTARELGGGRVAQGLAAAAMFPVALVFSTVLQYNTFDLLAWVMVGLFVARLLRTGDGRWWLGVGFAVGFGVLSKYSIAFEVISLLAALAMTRWGRRQFATRWFWVGALVALGVALPNVVWLARHGFVTLRMEEFIHARDVRLGRARGYWTDQLRFTMAAFPLAVVGLVWLLRSGRFRLLSALYLGPLVLLALAKGRGYYLLPGYAALYAAAGVAVEQWLAGRRRGLRWGIWGAMTAGLMVTVGFWAWAYLPMWRVGSAGWNWQMRNNEDMANEVGWPEFVAQVAAVRDRLPAVDRTRLAVLANNYGEAGALELYGPRYALPEVISSVNSFHARGFGPYAPETVIVVGSGLEDQLRNFAACAVAGHVVLPFGVRNEETEDHPEILVCRGLRGRWTEVWGRSQKFG